MPNTFACTVCGVQCYAKQLKTPYGCAHCLCANCGERITANGHIAVRVISDGVIVKKEIVYVCEKSTAPF